MSNKLSCLPIGCLPIDRFILVTGVVLRSLSRINRSVARITEKCRSKQGCHPSQRGSSCSSQSALWRLAQGIPQGFSVSPSPSRVIAGVPGLPRVSPRFKRACQLGQRLQGPHGVSLVPELILHRKLLAWGRSHLVGLQATEVFPSGVNYSV